MRVCDVLQEPYHTDHTDVSHPVSMRYKSRVVQTSPGEQQLRSEIDVNQGSVLLERFRS